MKHEDCLSEKDFAHIDTSIMLEYEEGFSSIEKCSDCVKAVYTDRQTGRRYPIRMECRYAGETSKLFRVETNFGCSVVRPEFAENVRMYIKLANEYLAADRALYQMHINGISIYSRKYDVNTQNCFELSENEDGSFVLVQSYCYDHEDVPSAVNALIEAISMFGDDLICLAKGRIPTDMLKERAMKQYMKQYITTISCDRELSLSVEEVKRLSESLSDNAPGAAGGDGNTEEYGEDDFDESHETEHTDEEIAIGVPFVGKSAADDALRKIRNLLESKKEPDPEDDDLA